MSEYKLKQNYYWAMGDNRDDSLDSRYWDSFQKILFWVETLLIFL